MINSSIENNLCEYVKKIAHEGEFNKHDEKLNAEDFFMRLFELIYGFKSLENLNYTERNAPGIDLYDFQKGIAIQITAIQSAERNKIETDTVKKIIKHHSSKKINEIICFFIRNNKALADISEKELSVKYGKKITIKTTRQIIGDFQKILSPEKKLRIEEIVRQELSPQFSGLGSVYNFIEFSKQNKNQEYITPDESIYFSSFEKDKIKEIASLFNKNKTREYAILGNPCSGKTTLVEAIYKNFIPHFRNRTFHLDLSDPDISGNIVLAEIEKLSFYRSILIIDNVHDNVKLFNRIRERIAPFEWIKTIYISRYYNSFREEDKNSILNIFKDIKTFRYNPSLGFEDKVSGIIENRVYHLKKGYPDFLWLKGDFKTILKNTDNNLLKLNIALETWISSTKKGNNLKFDQVNNDRIYEHFYEHHGLKEFDEELLYLYSYLFSHDISFLKIRFKSEEFRKLKEKGIILNYTTSDYYYFPHKDYAHLIHQTLIKEKGLSLEDLIILLTKYIENYRTESELNITELIIKLSVSKQFEITREILNNEKVLDLLSNRFKSNIRAYEVFELQKIFFQSFDYLNNPNQSFHYNLFIEYYSINKLELFICKDYSVYNNLCQIASLLNLELGNIIKTLRINEQANTNSITELTMRISKKRAFPETINRILNSFHFHEWLCMIENLPTFSRITISLSELNTSHLSRSLLVGIIHQLDLNKLKKKALRQKLDQFAKSIRELEKIDQSIGTNISKRILTQILESEAIKMKIKESNLSEYSKSMSDLSSVAQKFVEKQLRGDLVNNVLVQKFDTEKNFKNISARILELSSKSKGFKDVFFVFLNNYLSSYSLINNLKQETELNSLLIFYELINRSDYKITESLKNKLSNIAEQNILKNTSFKSLLSNPKVLRVELLKEKLKSLIDSQTLNELLRGQKFTIAESTFTVLSQLDKKRTIDSYLKMDTSIVLTAMCHKELNISQSVEVLNKVRNKTFVNGNINSNLFSSNILDSYLTIQRADQYQYSRLNFGDFLKAFDFSLKINFNIAIKHFENDFLKKLKVSNNKNLTISSLFQSLRRIEEMTDSKYNNAIREFLKLYKAKFLNGIKNENLAKTTSGLVELSKCDLKDYADELLYEAKNIVIIKIKQLNGDKILKAKIFPDIEKIAIGKAKIILTEIKASR